MGNMRKKRIPPFNLTHAALAKIFGAYHIDINPGDGGPEAGQGLILFAFRGCLPIKPMAGWGERIALRPVPIDHINMRCTLGIWDPFRKRLFAAAGSTVPHKDNVEKAAARKGKLKGKGTNQLEPGFYTDLAKGEHLQGKRNGHQALRQTAGRFYRRSLTGAPYTEAAPLFYGNPYDNLHCGWNLDAVKPGFSSAGCMVVAGIPHCPRREDAGPNQGPWKIFHDLLYATTQKSFPLLLLPAESAAEALGGIAATAKTGRRGGRSGSDRNLVYGSSGEAVKELQRRLASKGRYLGRISGRLDARTYRAWKR
jgi:hypothetical protein